MAEHTRHPEPKPDEPAKAPAPAPAAPKPEPAKAPAPRSAPKPADADDDDDGGDKSKTKALKPVEFKGTPSSKDIEKARKEAFGKKPGVVRLAVDPATGKTVGRHFDAEGNALDEE